MTTLTEQFKQGKLEAYKRYYCKTVWFEDIFMARCHNKGQNDEWWTLENEKYSYNNAYHIKDIEVLAEVPSYEEWEQLQNWADFTNDYHGLREKLEIAEYENAQLKELLKTHKLLFELEKDNTKNVLQRGKYAYLINDIDQVLANNQIQANTVACNKIQENNDA